LLGKTVALAGSPSQEDMDNFHALVQAEGGQQIEEVTQTLDYLVFAGPKRASEPLRKQAVQLNKTQGGQIQVLKLQEFFAQFHPDRELALALFQMGEPGVERFTLLHRVCRQPLDLSRAELGGFNGPCLAAPGVCFQKACLDTANLYRAILSSCDFTEADLQRGRLIQADLSHALLPGANLREADLTNANLTGADLSRADLRGALLFDADLSHARIDGARFEDVDVRGVKLTGTNPGKAIGLAPEATIAEAGRIGPFLTQLAALLQQAVSFKLALRLEREGENHVTVSVFRSDLGRKLFASSYRGGLSSYFSPAQTVDVVLFDMARRWPGCQLSRGRIQVHAHGVNRTNRELKRLVLAAWCEAAGLPLPAYAKSPGGWQTGP
jgi:uncharacterized protein YjbI with pentapeptide repeats